MMCRTTYARSAVAVVIVLAGLFAAETTQAQSAGSPESATVHGSVWDARSILRRVDQLDPRLRVKAAERGLAEVAVHRARWERVQGRIRLQAGHQVSSAGWLATDRGATSTTDQATAAAVAEVRLPLYAGGRWSAALDAAKARVQLSEHDTDALRLELAAAALQAYAEGLAAREQEAVAQRAWQRAQDLVGITRKKRDSGIDTEADVARAELNLVRYDEDLALRRGATDVALTALRSLLLLDDRAPMTLSGTLAALSTVSGPRPADHPELAAARAALEAARADERTEESAYLPSVELFALGQYGNTVPGAPDTPASADRFGPMSGSAVAGVLAGWTVWDFFATRDRVAEARQRVAIRRAEHDTVDQSLRARRNAAIQKERAGTARLLVLTRGQDIADRAIRLARARYETGNGTLTEVLDAELEAIRLDTNRVQASLEVALARIERMQAEGSRP